MFKVIVKDLMGNVEMTNKFDTYKEAYNWALNEDARLNFKYTFEFIEEVCENGYIF